MNIHKEIDGEILILTIDRPDKLNALNLATMEELKLHIQSLYDTPSLRAAIITGGGTKAFVAGADIAEIANLNEIQGRRASENGQEIFALIENSPKPIVAAINGYALGGGCELALACHFRLASTQALFAQPEINLGIIPGYGATQRLPLIVGKSYATYMMLSGETINADKAKEIGLVMEVCSTEELIPRCKELLQKFLLKSSICISLILDSVQAVYRKQEDGYQTEANGFASCISTEDFKEGTRAFLEKRKPVFHGK